MSTVHETWSNATTILLRSDPKTCIGCHGYKIGQTACRRLIKSDACQKRLEARSRLLAVIVQLVTIAVTHHREQEIGAVIKALLDAAQLPALVEQ